MSYETKYPDWKDRVITASKNSKSASKAAVLLGIKYDTYKKYAIKYNCFNTNQAGKGIPNDNSGITFDIWDILNGLHPTYLTSRLKKRCIKEGILINQCEICDQLPIWNNKLLVLQLDHIDGNKYNHKLNNLRILCPNCHTQTDTFSGKRNEPA